MTDIRIVYDSFTKKAAIYIEQEELTAKENRICAFLSNSSFLDCLLPLRKRYLVWDGLLPELINEVNDDELRIIFEGQVSDYLILEDAFHQSVPRITELGYADNWRLEHMGDFAAELTVGVLNDLAKKLREMCESRAELSEIDHYLRQMQEEELMKECDLLAGMIAKHMEKWENSGSPYAGEKIMYLELLQDHLRDAEKQLENYFGR